MRVEVGFALIPADAAGSAVIVEAETVPTGGIVIVIEVVPPM